MKNKKLLITIIFIVYLAIVFYMFYNEDKKILAILSSVGSAVYVTNISRKSIKK